MVFPFYLHHPLNNYHIQYFKIFQMDKQINQPFNQTNIHQPLTPSINTNTMAVRRASTKRVSRKRRATARRASVPRAPKRRSRKRVSRKRVTRRAVRKPKKIIGSMRRVWSGTADKTKGGLVKKDLMINKRGKVVSKKSSVQGAKRFKKSGLGRWVQACQRARKELGLTGFVACKKGTAYYKLAKKYFN